MQYGRPQFGMQSAQANALRNPQVAPTNRPNPMPDRAPGMPMPQLPQFQPTQGGLAGGPVMGAGPQLMGTGPQQPTYIHPAENPGGGMAPPPVMPQQPMGRPSFGYGQGNRFGGNMGYGRGGRFGGNRGYGGR